MAVVRSDVLGIAPELASIADANRFTVAIADAYAEVSADAMGSRLDVSVKCLVAHRLTLQERMRTGGGRGQLTGVTVGPTSKTYATPQAAVGVPPEYAGTEYGVRFWGYVESSILSPQVL